MRFLLDEGLPIQLLDPLNRNVPHAFQHVDQLKWKGKPDKFLFPDAARKGFDGILALDVDQLSNPHELRIVRDSALHHISLRQGRGVRGKKGVARVIASLVVAMPYVLEDLEQAHGVKTSSA